MPLSAEEAAALRRQVEFYFSDVNVVKDAFLKAKMAESPEGFVPLSVLLTFNRVVRFTKDPEDLRDALRGSDALVIDDATMAVRRAKPIPADLETDSRTVYAKPIPATETLEAITEFFGRVGPVLAVWRRYFPGGSGAKGDTSRVKASVFVVFESKDTVDAIIANPPTYKDAKLEVVKKTEYLARKAAEIAQRRPAATARAPAAPRPAMPTGASYSVVGVGSLERFADIKALWPAEEQKGIRYVHTPSKEDVQIVFQSEEVGKAMVTSATSRGVTLNGKIPTFTLISGDAEAAMLKAVEDEIKQREENHAAQGRGRGRGRGGGKRPRK